MTDPNDLVPIGFIRAAHGLQGALLVHAYSGQADSLTAYGPLQDAIGDMQFTLTINGPKDKDFICRAKGITTRTEAEKIRGIKLFIVANKLPPASDDEYYHRDLLGLKVENTDGNMIGIVRDVLALAQGDALLIEFNRGETQQTELLLFTKENVPFVSVSEKRIVVELPDGLFEDVAKS